MGKTFQIVPAYDPVVIREQVLQNTALGLPPVDFGSRSGAIAICGNGPSLREIYPQDGLPICALNGAWRALKAKGITPDYIAALDPTIESASWFEDSPTEPVYLISSRMHPKAFENLKGKKVKIWHMLDDIEHGLKMPDMIGAGNFIANHAINLLASMGFNHFELYGCDACYAMDGEHHATPQSWGITPPLPFNIGERMFIAEPWMAAQTEEFLSQVEHNRFDYTVNVHGDGLLKNALDHNTLEAVYDLDQSPGSWDFFWAMMNIENYRRGVGYNRVKVHFKAGSDKGFRPNEPVVLSLDHKSLMINKVVRPMLRMFGMEETDHVSDKATPFDYAPRHVIECWNETGELPKFYESVTAKQWAKHIYPEPFVTITLREAEHWQIRNSNLTEWIKFAEQCGERVIFIRDTAKAYEGITGFETCPIASVDVDHRLALYRRAKMNFFINNGPQSFGWGSQDIPYLTVDTEPDGYVCVNDAWIKAHMGLDHHQQWPWYNPEKQLRVWCKDTCANIQSAWEKLR